MDKIDIYFPKPTGPYAVGTTMYHVIDTSRKNEFSEDSEHPYRELMVQVWYPAQGAAADVLPVQYAPDAIHYWKEKIAASGADIHQVATLENIFVYEKKMQCLHKNRHHFHCSFFHQALRKCGP